MVSTSLGHGRGWRVPGGCDLCFLTVLDDLRVMVGGAPRPLCGGAPLVNVILLASQKLS